MHTFVQSAGAREYTNRASGEDKDFANEFPGHDTKQSESEILVMLELWEIRSTLSLSSFHGSLCPGVLAPAKGPIDGSNKTKHRTVLLEIEVLTCKHKFYKTFLIIK